MIQHTPDFVRPRDFVNAQGRGRRIDVGFCGMDRMKGHVEGGILERFKLFKAGILERYKLVKKNVIIRVAIENIAGRVP
jgi:hypothetical protein